MSTPKIHLIMQTGPNVGKFYELKQEKISLGRDVSNDIVINDPEVSRRHAQLKFQSNGYTIEDLGSTNGTFVDGQKLIGPHTLVNEETVMFGENVSLVYQSTAIDSEATVIGRPPTTQKPQEPPDTYRVPPSEQRFEEPAFPRTEMVAQEAHIDTISSEEELIFGEEPHTVAQDRVPPKGKQLSYDRSPIPTKKKNKPIIIAGCGCLFLFTLCIVGAAFAFDMLNLYCSPPFNALSGILWSCPP
jgi:pSer/pThr/pTyr-binding forkhead associated (FHA) protein